MTNRIFRTVRKAVASIAFATWGCAALADPAPLVAVADEWPPFSGAALPGEGMSLDVIASVLTAADIPVTTQVVPWARIMGDADIGQFDIIGSLFADPEMATYLHYSDPFYVTAVQLVQRVGTGHRFTSVPDLRPYRIAVGDGFLYEDEFDRADYLEKEVVTTTLQALRMVAAGRVDLTLDSVDVVRHAVTVEDPTLADQLSIAPGVLARQGIHMAIRRDIDGSAEIVAAFNKTLAEMRADGRLARVLARHTMR